jgi:hypothetical protein
MDDLTDPTIILKCLQIENLVKHHIMRGLHDNESLVGEVDLFFPPSSEEELEAFSEAIIYAKQSVMN